jgi:alkylated DNA nucleotide flippase Atl1
VNRLRQHHRWAPWWFVALLGLPYCALAYAVVLAVVDPAKGGEGIRLFLPLFGIFTYWVLAVTLNMRTAVVTPTGVSVRLLPFPIGNGQKIKRADIAVCYCRHIVEYEDDQEIENFYTAGVETTKGQQIDVYIPIATAAESHRAAYEIGRILNANPAERPIPVHTVVRAAHDATFLRQALAWSGILIVAVLVGAFWGP